MTALSRPTSVSTPQPRPSARSNDTNDTVIQAITRRDTKASRPNGEHSFRSNTPIWLHVSCGQGSTGHNQLSVHADSGTRTHKRHKTAESHTKHSKFTCSGSGVIHLRTHQSIGKLKPKTKLQAYFVSIQSPFQKLWWIIVHSSLLERVRARNLHTIAGRQGQILQLIH